MIPGMFKVTRCSPWANLKINVDKNFRKNIYGNQIFLNFFLKIVKIYNCGHHALFKRIKIKCNVVLCIRQLVFLC